jgi:H+/Cl- antiporter ClcA
MSSILNTRKTVSTYIFVNIAYIIICSVVALIIVFNNDANFINLLHKSEANGEVALFYLLYIGLALVFIGIFILIIWLFYKLIYGLLLKRLRRNYDELKKIDF